jgi:hypothetical protein
MGVQIVGGGVGPVNPRTFGGADFSQASPTVGQWYTVVNISGKGILQRVSGQHNVYTNQNIQLRITIDGTPVAPSAFANSIYSRGFSLLNTGSYVNRYYSYDVIFRTKFNSSLKVEILTNVNSSNNLDCSVDYALF